MGPCDNNKVFLVFNKQGMRKSSLVYTPCSVSYDLRLYSDNVVAAQRKYLSYTIHVYGAFIDLVVVFHFEKKFQRVQKVSW